MRRRTILRNRPALLAAALIVVLVAGSHTGAQDDDKPELTLRPRPQVALAPAEITFTGRLRGGSDNSEEFYCLSAEWDWGDDTVSESIFDCDPYEPGVSEIRRRFSRRHSFQYGGRYQVSLSLKRRNDVVAFERTSVVINGGFPGE